MRSLALRGIAVSILVGCLVRIPEALSADASLGIAEQPKHAVNLWVADRVESFWYEGAFTGPDVLGIVDVTCDGIPDILAAQELTVYVLPGRGDGTFEFEKYHTPFTESSLDGVNVQHGMVQVSSSLLLDIDEDGDFDLVVAGRFADPGTADFMQGIAVLEQQDGCKGRFLQPAEIIGIPDSLLHLAVLSSDTEGFVLLGTSQERDGERDYCDVYTIPCSRELMLGTPEKVAQLSGWPFHLGDFDLDGAIDIGLVLYPDEISIAYGDNHGFTEIAALASEEQRIRNASAADVNRDGLLDLLVARADGVAILLSTEQGYTEVSTLPLEADEVYFWDFDQDGYGDLLIQSRNQIKILPGLGIGRFRTECGSSFVLPVSPRRILSDNLNQDGSPDLIVTSPYYGVSLLNGGHAKGETMIPFDGSFPLGVGDIDGNGATDILVERFDGIDVLYNKAQGEFTRMPWLSLVDFHDASDDDGDKPLDLVRAVQSREGTLYVLGQREQVCVSNGIPKSCAQSEIHAFSENGEWLTRWDLGMHVVGLLGLGDFDGDGSDDVVATSRSTLHVLWGGQDLRTYAWRGEGAGAFTIGDFDGDGVDELAAVHADNTTNLNLVSFSSQRKWRRSKLLVFEGMPLALTAADIDGDGITDLLAAIARLQGETLADGSPQISLEGIDIVARVSATDAILTTPVSILPEQTLPWPLDGLATTDINGDGHNDVLLSTLNGAATAVLLGDGEGSFPGQTRMSASIGPQINADLDGNGTLDVISVTVGLDPALWILWNGGAR